MNLYRARKILWAAAAPLAAAVVLGGLLTALGPLGLEGGRGGDDAIDAAASASQPAGDDGSSRSLAHYRLIWERDLRRPLFDPPPTVAQTPPKPKLALTLLGTALEADAGYAMVKTADGKTRFCQVGDKVAEAEILAIGLDAVQVRFAGEILTLKRQVQGDRP